MAEFNADQFTVAKAKPPLPHYRCLNASKEFHFPGAC